MAVTQSMENVALPKMEFPRFLCNTPVHLLRCYRVYRALIGLKFVMARLCNVVQVVTKFQDNSPSEQHLTTHQTHCLVVMLHCSMHHVLSPLLVVMPSVQGQRVGQDLQVVKRTSTTLL